jgi:hypothetical protein
MKTDLKVKTYTFQSSTLNEDEWSVFHSSCFTHVEMFAATHWITRWLSLRDSLKVMAVRKIPTRIKN